MSFYQGWVKNATTFWQQFFTDKDDAIRARLLAEKKYYGLFASQQYLFEQYGIEVGLDG